LFILIFLVQPGVVRWCPGIIRLPDRYRGASGGLPEQNMLAEPTWIGLDTNSLALQYRRYYVPIFTQLLSCSVARSVLVLSFDGLMVLHLATHTGGFSVRVALCPPKHGPLPSPSFGMLQACCKHPTHASAHDGPEAGSWLKPRS